MVYQEFVFGTGIITALYFFLVEPQRNVDEQSLKRRMKIFNSSINKEKR